mmetsp:Transcript_31070/g.96110  ORF Transcript_31070/g.96110 Transcript_31070/m.96110 type:complete len:81 (-) Transcript_31070:22-264(-)
MAAAFREKGWHREIIMGWHREIIIQDAKTMHEIILEQAEEQHITTKNKRGQRNASAHQYFNRCRKICDRTSTLNNTRWLN